MSRYHHIRQLVAQEFFPTRSAVHGKQQKLVFKIKSPLKYKSLLTDMDFA